MNNRPTIVQFGAGAIGRGFLGQLWTEGGFEVVYVDVDERLVTALNERKSYLLRLVNNDNTETREIAPVRAINGRDGSAVADALADCAFACTAVGVSVFTHLAPVLREGGLRRSARNASPLNILCCENQAGAGELLRQAVGDAQSKRMAFVDAAVGRMVPPAAPELLAEDPLLLLAEPYKELPIDARAWRGPLPMIPGLLPKDNFAGYIARKLFVHNGGHALLAYEGFLRGHEFIWQCAEDAALVRELRGYWDEIRTSLVATYNFNAAEQRDHEKDLLQRFRNRALGDTVARVGRDPQRKLRRDDRLVGAAILCEQYGIVPHHSTCAIAAALRFEADGDPTAPHVRALIAEQGVRGALETLAGVAVSSTLATLVEAAYNG